MAHRSHKRLIYLTEYEKSEFCEVWAAQDTQEATGQDVLQLLLPLIFKGLGSDQYTERLWSRMKV